MRFIILLCLIAYVQSNPCDEIGDDGVFNCEGCEQVFNNQFKDCEKLVTFIGPNVHTIWYDAFRGCTSLQTFTGSDVQTIYGGAFYGSGLQNFDFSNVQTIYWRSFQNTNLQGDISLPNVTGMIGNYAFQNTGLSSVDAPKATQIGIETFRNCWMLRTFNGPNVNTIWQWAFQYTYNLETVYAQSCNTIHKYAFDSSGIKNLHLPVYTQFGWSIFINNTNPINIYSWYNGQQLNTFFDNGGKLLDSNTPASDLSGLSVSQLSEIPVNTIQEAFENKDGVVLDSSRTAAELEVVSAANLKSAYQSIVTCV